MHEHFSGMYNSVLIDHDFSLGDVLDELYEQKVQSIMVEGGREIHEAFISQNLWDEARVFKGRMKFSQGVEAPNMKEEPYEIVDFQGCELKLYYNSNKIDS